MMVLVCPVMPITQELCVWLCCLFRGCSLFLYEMSKQRNSVDVQALRPDISNVGLRASESASP